MSGVVVRLEDAAAAEGLLAAVPPPHARVLIARIDGAAAGVLVLAPGPDDFAEVLELVVASVHRRTGVARRLVAAAESWARGIATASSSGPLNPGPKPLAMRS